MLSGAIIAIVEFLLTHVPAEQAFFKEAEKILRAAFSLIIKANHPNTVLTKLAVTGTAVLDQIDADADPSAARAAAIDPTIGG